MKIEKERETGRDEMRKREEEKWGQEREKERGSDRMRENEIEREREEMRKRKRNEIRTFLINKLGKIEITRNLIFEMAITFILLP